MYIIREEYTIKRVYTIGSKWYRMEIYNILKGRVREIRVEERMKCEKNETTIFSYEKINIPFNGQIVTYIGLFKNNDTEVHVFTDFLFDKIKNFSILNKSFNTQKNFYVIPLIKFLNFVFNESKQKITSIEDLKFEMIGEFLNLYSKGLLADDKLNRWRNADIVDKTNHVIKHFAYWLCIKKIPKTNKKLFKMKYMKESDFSFSTKIVKDKNGLSSTQIEVLNDIVAYERLEGSTKRHKVTSAGVYTVFKLIEISESQDPMMTFGIVLGAFCGLRAGEVVQIHRGRLKGFDNDILGGWIDLSKDEILRSDGKLTGNIKVKKNLLVYEGFSEIVKFYYKKHIDFLISKGLNNNIYGALFLNNNGTAMLEKTYLKRYNKLTTLLYKNVLLLAEKGVEDAVLEKEILETGKLTPHSLRYFFTQFLKEECEENPITIANYRGDTNNNIKTQKIYLAPTINKKMQAVIDLIWEEFNNARK